MPAFRTGMYKRVRFVHTEARRKTGRPIGEATLLSLRGHQNEARELLRGNAFRQSSRTK